MTRTSILFGAAGAVAALTVLLGVGSRASGECCSSRAARGESVRQVAGATDHVVLVVEGMHCATCPVTVRVTLERLDGVKSASVSRKEGKAYIEYDPTKISPERMAKAVTDAGYPSRVAGSS
jgi:mercuric ion binding protein